jgi:ribosomal protein S21
MPNNYNNAYGVEVKNDDVEKALEVFSRRVRKCKRLLKYKQNKQFTKDSKERREERRRKKFNARMEAAKNQWWKEDEHLKNIG